MLIIYRGLGLVWGFLGILVLLLAYLITGSVGTALSTVATCWIFFGRGQFEPKWCQVLDSEGKRKAPAVFFIPVWVYGILVIPLALGGFFLDLVLRLSHEVRDPDGQHANADSTNVNSTDQGRFERANHAITTSKNGSFHGNSEMARELASAYSGLMKEISEAAFTGGGKGAISLTDGEFLVYCQMNEGKSVALLVHVPQLRQYKNDVRDALADLSWKAARTLLKDKGVTDDTELVVALRGTMLYGPIMIDRLANETTSDDRSKESLYRFFPEPTNEIAAAVQAADINLSSSSSLNSNDGDIKRCKTAEDKLNAGESFQGNTRTAVDLATEYSIRLSEELQEVRFDNGGTVLNSSCRICCQMNEGQSIALLVQIPELDQYKADMLEILASSCWKTARTLFKNKGNTDDMELAVALRGIGHYGPIMIDGLAIKTTRQDQSEESLYRFFPEPSTDSTEGEFGAINEPSELTPAQNSAEGPNSDVNHDSSTSLPQSPTTPRPFTAGPDAPGEPVTAETELRPGQKLAGYWGGEWSQVVVTGFDRDTVLTGWVHSNAWTSFRMSRSNLRLVSDEEYAQCKVSYNDEPIVYPPLAEDVELKSGQQLLCKIEQFWLPVEVTGPEVDVGVPVHWIGFSSDFDDHVERSRLTLPHSGASNRKFRPSTRP